MRSFGLTLAALLLAGPALRAQQPAPPAAPPPPPNADRLDTLLRAWEQRTKGINALNATCTRTELDKTSGSKDEFNGTAKYLKPNLARLHLDKKGEPNSWEEYICTGTALYEFRPKQKLVRVHELRQPNNGAVADDTFLSFLFGMKADEAKKRYALRLVKEDEWWVYVEILPRFAEDKQEFARAQMVLYAPSQRVPAALQLLPRRLWFEHPNGNEVTWEFPRIDPNARLEKTEFVAPRLDGWNVQKAAPPAPPRPPAPGGPPAAPRNPAFPKQ